MTYLLRRVLAKPRLIVDEMCRLYGKFASYLRRVSCKTRLNFSRINGPILPKTRENSRGRMTTATTFSRQSDAGSRVSNTQY